MNRAQVAAERAYERRVERELDVAALRVVLLDDYNTNQGNSEEMAAESEKAQAILGPATMEALADYVTGNHLDTFALSTLPDVDLLEILGRVRAE